MIFNAMNPPISFPPPKKKRSPIRDFNPPCNRKTFNWKPQPTNKQTNSSVLNQFLPLFYITFERHSRNPYVCMMKTTLVFCVNNSYVVTMTLYSFCMPDIPSFFYPPKWWNWQWDPSLRWSPDDCFFKDPRFPFFSFLSSFLSPREVIPCKEQDLVASSQRSFASPTHSNLAFSNIRMRKLFLSSRMRKASKFLRATFGHKERCFAWKNWTFLLRRLVPYQTSSSQQLKCSIFLV